RRPTTSRASIRSARRRRTRRRTARSRPTPSRTAPSRRAASPTAVDPGAAAVTRDEGWTLLCEWTKGDALRKHARAVERVRRAARGRYGGGSGDVELFGLAGMLHDADYEQWPQEHPKRIVAWLRERGEAALAHAISAHYTKWNVPYESALDKALLACDELTGF